MTDVFNGGGEMGARMRAFDWASTPFGEPYLWPQSLRSALGICLNSRFPIAIYWGESLALFYNDAWSPILGEKHPIALGQPGREVWPEIWPEIGPLFEAVQRGGEGVWQQDQLLPMHRHGYTEECYFNFTFSPMHGEDGSIAGIFNAVIETTFRIIEERRARTLRDLSERTGGATASAEVCARAVEVLGASPADVPFCLLYLREDESAPLQLAAAAGTNLPASLCPASLDPSDPAGPWPLSALHAPHGVVADQLGERFGVTLPGGIWPEPVERALVVPIPNVQTIEPAGLLIVGVSPRRALDEAYRTFIERIAMQVATALGNARAYEAERRRAEALAVLDQAKTTFFSNVSHEFRTPLTLLLGPLEDTLAQADGLPADTRERLDLAYRNALRLLKLVNTLLDFSRIEADRVQASYEPTDLASFTADLASAFRSAIERAGLRLIVRCPPLAAPVYVDREMWEKIVFNLLSNAFKFTFQGEIEVALRQVGATVELAVRDTGIGIPADEIPHLFERFHRVKGARGRTFEGSGIGLALVQELVKLHSGAVRVESEVAQGTAFTIVIPTGTAHLPADRIGVASTLATTALPGEAYVEEALRWLPEDNAALWAQAAEPMSEPQPATDAEIDIDAPHARILLVDDNADMREYIRRLLSQKWTVVAVNDGAAALQVARTQPFDLVLTDVMMPHLDGFGLLAALRADERLKTLPIILLSARAGEESHAEGLEAGADDYLIKPFSARELLARVGAHLTMARIRREAEERFRHIANAAPVLIWIADTTKQRIWFNKPWLHFTGRTLGEEYGYGWVKGVHADDIERYLAISSEAFDAREPFSIEYRLRRYDGAYRWLLVNGVPHFAPSGEFIGYIGSCVDINDRKQVEDELRLVNERFRIAEGASNGFIYDWDVASDTVMRSDSFTSVLGYAPGDISHTSAAWRALIYPEDLARIRSLLDTLQPEGRTGSRNEYRVRHKDGGWVWVLDENAVLYREGKIWRIIGSTVNITEQKRRELNATFLGDIAADLALLTSSNVMLRAVGEKIASHLAVSRCLFCEVKQDIGRVAVFYEYRDQGLPSLSAEHSAADWISADFWQALVSGRDVVIDDVTSDPRTRPGMESLTQAQIESCIVAPCLSGGQLKFVLVIGHRQAHQWRADERDLVHEMALRIWLSYDRARAEAELHEAQANRLAEQQQHAARLQQLNIASLAINAAPTRDDVLTMIAEQARTLIGTRQAIVDFARNGNGLPMQAVVSLAEPLTSSELAARPQPNEVMVPLTDSDGERIGMLQLLDKTTGAFTAADEALLQQLAQMASVAIENQTLYEQEQAARAQAEEASQLKDEFLATVSHELRTPLTALLGYAQLLRGRKRDEAYVARTAEKLVRSAKDQALIIDDLLDVSRIVTGKLRIEPRPTDLIPVIHAALDTVRPAVEAKRLQLEVDLDPAASIIVGDANRLQQVVWNLLSNAAKFTLAGGVIQVRLMPDGRYAQLTVRDTGQGIRAPFLPFVFDRFRQADSTSNRSHGGLGLGLAIVRHLVELHGGTVRAASDGEGLGSTFTVRLPLSITRDPAASQRSVADDNDATINCPPELRGLRVLVVDDQQDILELLHDILSACGCVVRLCNSAWEALATLRSWKPDVLVSDIAMPSEDGYWLIHHIRELAVEDGGATPAIALTAYVRAEERVRVLEAGFQLYVPKPVEPAELLNVIAHLVRMGVSD